MKLLTETYKNEISFILSRYDRIIIIGTLPEISYSQGMTGYMYRHQERIFDYPKFAEPFKETIRANAERVAKENDLEIEFIRKSGIVHIISAMEACPTYKPRHNKTTGKTFLSKPIPWYVLFGSLQCVHYNCCQLLLHSGGRVCGPKKWRCFQV
jgi:hypothetical protein